MQIIVANRKQMYRAVTETSDPIDVQGIPRLSLDLTVNSISGTTPQVDAQLQTSDDLETWANVGGVVDRTSTGLELGAILITSTEYGRYVRVQYTLSGTDPLANVTICVNTFAA